MSACTSAPDARNRELARIHILAKEIGLDRGEYEDLLFALGRTRTAAALGDAGRRQVLDHLAKLARKIAVKEPAKAAMTHGVKPDVPADRQGQIGKIEALLADARRPWNYAESMAKRICKVDSLRFCTAAQLGKIIAALMYDQKRREAQNSSRQP